MEKCKLCSRKLLLKKKKKKVGEEILMVWTRGTKFLVLFLPHFFLLFSLRTAYAKHL